MSRLTSSQIIIFVATAFLISLIVNILLFIDQIDTQQQMQLLQQSHSDQEQVWSKKEQTYEAQLAQLKQLGGQQSELRDIVKQLSKELNILETEQQQTVETAQLTKNQLNQAQQRITQLATELKAKTEQLIEADKTNQNLRRALLQARNETNTPSRPAIDSSLTTELTGFDTDISVTQMADGSTVVNIPLEKVFLNTDFDFTEQAESILSIIAQELIHSPESQAVIIGHADERPIISDLALRYPTNWELSSARASKVVNYLIGQGVNSSNLLAAGKASNQPVRDGNNADDYAVNRRIEIQIRY